MEAFLWFTGILKVEYICNGVAAVMQEDIGRVPLHAKKPVNNYA
jgi:hypothetical protein